MVVKFGVCTKEPPVIVPSLSRASAVTVEGVVGSCSPSSSLETHELLERRGSDCPWKVDLEKWFLAKGRIHGVDNAVAPLVRADGPRRGLEDDAMGSFFVGLPPEALALPVRPVGSG